MRSSGPQSSPSTAKRLLVSLTVATLLLFGAWPGCSDQPDPGLDNGREAGASSGPGTPAQAVRRLTRHLHDSDLAAFARDAVPPELLAQLETAWRAGATRWPLTELPLSAKLPQALAALSAPGSEKALQATFDRQFANAGVELKSTANTLGLFAAQYVSREGDFSDDERAHDAQLVTAMSAWGQAAPLSDRKLARAAISRLAAAARLTGLRSEADFSRHGMQGSLRRLQPFVIALKRVLAAYGLRLDDDLAAMDAMLQSQTGDSARVRLRYTLGPTPVDTVVGLERIDGRWYVSDHLRRARVAVAAAAPSTTAATAAR